MYPIRRDIMTLLHLVYYVEVCHTQNFIKAAANLHVTQPTITNAVKALEDEFHLRLIDRNNKSFIITEAGQTLLEMTIQMLEYHDWINIVMRDKAAHDLQLRVGIPNMSNAACFPWFFSVLHKSNPELEILTAHDLTASLLPQLSSGKLDMLIVPYRPAESQFINMEIMHSRFLFCVSKDSPYANRTHVSIGDICHEPIISYFGDQYLRNLGIIEKYRSFGGELSITYRCNQISVLLNLIRKNEGCGFLIEEVVADEQGIVGIPVDEELPVTLYLVWTRESARLSSVKKVLSCFQKLLPCENISYP